MEDHWKRRERERDSLSVKPIIPLPRTYFRLHGIDTTNSHFTFDSCLFNHRSLILRESYDELGSTGRHNTLASARLVDVLRLWQEWVDSREFACRMRMKKKAGRDFEEEKARHKNWLLSDPDFLFSSTSVSVSFFSDHILYLL